MKIATGYFAKAQTYHNMGYSLVSVARTRPWFLPKELLVWYLSDLAPTGEIIGAKDNPKVYEKKYNEEILSKTSAQEILRKLERYAELECKEKVALLCYESPEKFCHRHIVAKWLGDALGVRIEEINLNHKEETLV